MYTVLLNKKTSKINFGTKALSETVLCYKNMFPESFSSKSNRQ